MDSKFNIYLNDVYDHEVMIESYDTYAEAKKAFDEFVTHGPAEFDLSVELTEVVGDYEDYIDHDYHEWMTYEEWISANPDK